MNRLLYAALVMHSVLGLSVNAIFASRVLCIAYICMHTSMLQSAEKQDVSIAQKFGIGFVSGALTVSITEPLLFIKNKLQQRLRERIMQHQQQASGQNISKKLGKISFNPRVMYRGVLISALGFGPNMALQNGGFHLGMTYAPDDRYNHIVAPVVAGCLSAPTSAVRELLTVQQQNHGGTYRNTLKRIGS